MKKSLFTCIFLSVIMLLTVFNPQGATNVSAAVSPPEEGWLWPVRDTSIGVPRSDNRWGLRGDRFHRGIDIHGRYNYVVATRTGTVHNVINCGCHRACNHHPLGNAIIVRHYINGITYISVYAHLLPDIRVRRGDTVDQNQIIGRVGSSGETNTAGGHLHFEIWRNTTQRDTPRREPGRGNLNTNPHTIPAVNGTTGIQYIASPRQQQQQPQQQPEDFRNQVRNYRAVTSNQQRFIAPANNAANAPIRSTPYGSGNELRRLNRGDQIIVVGFGTNTTNAQNRWYRVSSPVHGWIYSGNISTSQPPGGGSGNNNQGITTITTSAVPTDGGSVQVLSGVLRGNSGRADVRLQANSANGWRFTGWYIGGSRISTNNPQNFHTRENRTIQARFVQQQTPQPPTGERVTIHFNANGGTGAPPSHTVNRAANGNVTIAFPNTRPTRSGYTFAGWRRNNWQTDSLWQPGNSFAASTPGTTFTFYAQWTPVPPQTPQPPTGERVTIHFNANGGTGAPPSHTVNRAANGNVTIAFPNTRPTRSGYTFAGWRRNNWQTDSLWQPGNSFAASTPGTTFTFYAQWIPVPQQQHTVTVRENANRTSGITGETVFNFRANTDFDASRVVIVFSGGGQFNMNRTSAREWFLNSRLTVEGTQTITVHAYEGNIRRASHSMQISSSVAQQPQPQQRSVTIRENANRTSGITGETVFNFRANTDFDASRVVIVFSGGGQFNMNRTNAREWFLNSRLTVAGTQTITVHAYDGNTRRASHSMQISSQPRN